MAMAGKYEGHKAHSSGGQVAYVSSHINLGLQEDSTDNYLRESYLKVEDQKWIWL